VCPFLKIRQPYSFTNWYIDYNDDVESDKEKSGGLSVCLYVHRRLDLLWSSPWSVWCCNGEVSSRQ